MAGESGLTASQKPGHVEPASHDPNPFTAKLFQILAALNYNSERGETLQTVLRNFLVHQDSSIDVVQEARNVWTQQEQETKDFADRTPEQKEEFMRSHWFQQDCVLSGNIRHSYVPEYVLGKFGRFREEFEKTLGFPVDALLSFSFGLLEYIQFKKHMVRLHGETYRFNSKEEYGDLGFVAMPDHDYVEKWRSIVTLDVRELLRVLSGGLSRRDIDRTLQVLSLDLEHLPAAPSAIRFPSKPLLRLDGDTVVVVEPDYLARGLPVVYEELSKKIRKFVDSKGGAFEGLVKENLKALPFKCLSFNVGYGKRFEVDAILEFKKSIWFVETTSHPPSAASLRGEPVAIERDLEKTVRKCLAQGRRCFSYLDDEPLSHFKKTGKKLGIFVVVDGVYPQLNMTTALKLFHEDVPTYVINWFDFRSLLEQSETYRFEDFLVWRTIQPMPIICFDEKDYWAFYFDHYDADPRYKEVFPMMQAKELRNFYISARFNNKDYLEKIA